MTVKELIDQLTLLTSLDPNNLNNEIKVDTFNEVGDVSIIDIDNIIPYKNEYLITLNHNYDY